jgi:hypothetical protein
LETFFFDENLKHQDGWLQLKWKRYCIKWVLMVMPTKLVDRFEYARKGILHFLFGMIAL